MWSRLSTLARAVRGRPQFEEGLAEEVRDHLERYVEDLIAAGVPRDTAWRRARIEFGNIDNVTLDCRQARGLRVFDELQLHLRYAMRMLWKTPAFTGTAVSTLALCFGASLTIFAVVDAVLLKPLPFPDPERLVSIFNTYPRAGVPDDGSSITNYYERRGALNGFSTLALYRDGAVIVGETGTTQREFITQVSPEFFRTLGTEPALGRAFTESETTHQSDHVAIVSTWLLAGEPRWGSEGSWTHPAHRRRSCHRRRGAAARIPIPVVEEPNLLPAGIESGRARSGLTTLGQLSTHDCPAGAGCHARRGAGADRRPQRAR